MRSVDFYEFVGILVPGAVLLLATGLLVNGGPAEDLLVPTGVGHALGYLVLAYVTGHLVQGLANWLEPLYWKAWKSMPTDWPITKPEHPDSKAWKRDVELYCGVTCNDGNLRKWRRMVGRVRSSVYATNRATRLHIFNGNYGMFRGLLIVGLILTTFAWQSSYSLAATYSILGAVIALSGSRMHRFALNYARELFNNVAELAAHGLGAAQNRGGNDA